MDIACCDEAVARAVESLCMEGKTRNVMISPWEHKTGNFNPRRTLSRLFFVIPAVFGVHLCHSFGVYR